MEFVTKERLINPYPDYKNWRENKPIWWAEDVNAWVVSTYKDVHLVLKNPKLFSSASMGERDHEISLPLLTDDPPRHTKLRAIMNKAFTSRAIRLMENEVRNMSNDLLNKLDISILPFIRQFRIADADWFDNHKRLKKVKNYLHNFLASKILKDVMINYDVWKEESEISYFPITNR